MRKYFAGPSSYRPQGSNPDRSIQFTPYQATGARLCWEFKVMKMFIFGEIFEWIPKSKCGMRKEDKKSSSLQKHRLIKIEANLDFCVKNSPVNTYLFVQSHSTPSCRYHLVKLAWMAWCRANCSFTLCRLKYIKTKKKKNIEKLTPKLRRPPPQHPH